MSHNKHLTHHVHQWTLQAEAAKRAADLYAVTAAMTQFGAPIKYKLAGLHTTAIAFLALAATLAISVFQSTPHPQWLRSLGNEIGWKSGFTGLSLVCAFGLLAFIFFAIARSKDNKITHLCNVVMHRASLLQYGLRRIDDTNITKELKTFGELRRGNYARHIHDCYQGEYQGEEHAFTYQPYRLHYVDKIERRVYNSQKEEWEDEVDYEHYDRSGVILDFPYATGIHICQGFESTLYGAPYKPASLEFDKKFHCRGQDKMMMARFLKPAIVQQLTEASSHIPSLTVEINQNGRMCLGCNHYHVVQTMRKLDSETNPRVSPEGFDRFIRASVSMPRLDMLTELAHTLLRYNSSNFSRQSA